MRSVDLSRGIDQLGRWSSGAQNGCIIVLIIVGLIVFSAIAKIVESVSGLFQ